MSRLRYTTSRLLRRIANRVHPKTTARSVAYPDIGKKNLPHNALRALVIYITGGVDRYVRGAFHDDDPFFNKHTMYWESVELVRQLNEHGYIVDYADHRSSVDVDWNQYDLVIGQRNNLERIPRGKRPVKIHYTTYTHWLPSNLGEYTRLKWFQDRAGIVVPWTRSMPPIMSDGYADYLTYFGTDLQAASFSARPRKHQLNISAVFTPQYRIKNIEKARKNFLWLGGGGMIHKGLDIAMEAFARTPDLHLFIAGNPKEEPYFWQWAEPFLRQRANIHLLGWMDVGSPAFDAIAHDCIGIVYPSAAEGGPGSVAQALHWGLIPIVTPTAGVRAEILGRTITGMTAESLIQSTVQQVQSVAEKSSLQDICTAVHSFAHQYHTRPAYTQSLKQLLQLLAQ